MSHPEGFQHDRSRPGGNPFGESGYSDQFVRSATQPLARKQTRPLGDASAVEAQLRAAEEQIQLCRTILDRFLPRVRLLKAAHDAALKATNPPPAPKKPGKPLPAKKPSASPPLSAQEKALVDRLTRRLMAKPDLARRAAIAATQFDHAARGVAEAATRLDQARFLDPVSALQILTEMEVSKLQGRVYPICNFYEVFKDDEVVASLFPPPSRPPSGGGRTYG